MTVLLCIEYLPIKTDSDSPTRAASRCLKGCPGLGSSWCLLKRDLGSSTKRTRSPGAAVGGDAPLAEWRLCHRAERFSQQLSIPVAQAHFETPSLTPAYFNVPPAQLGSLCGSSGASISRGPCGSLQHGCPALQSPSKQTSNTTLRKISGL